ncbi:MAG TPA: nucleotide exchange factor GrpE [Bacteroidales bacterium]|nr:nucleotide exchange factor GrpE [Bacteroidales bacterium]
MKKAKHEEVKMENDAQQPTGTDNISAQQNEQMTEQNSNNAEDVEKTEASVAQFEKEAAEWKDKYMRLSAEFDNYRKRTLKEKMDLTKYAGEEMLKSLLPVVDDFERGLATLEQSNDIDAVKQGIELIYAKFISFIQQKGLKEIEAKNLPFDTDFHEAVTKIPVEDKEMSGKVVDVIQKGYLLDEKVVRFAKVVVGE